MSTSQPQPGPHSSAAAGSAHLGSFYSSNPVRDAERHFDHLASTQAEQAAGARHEAMLAGELLRAVAAQPLATPAHFAGRITDYSRGAAHAFKRHPTLAEVLGDALDYPGGPSHDDLLAFLTQSARAGSAPAQGLLRRMAFTWAAHQAR